MEAFSVLLLLAAIYFLPLFIAIMREHRQSVAIGILTLFLGWTLLGWVAALVWSFTNSPNREAGR